VLNLFRSYRDTKSGIDPIALLDAHQKARSSGMRMLSVLVGPPSRGRATFGAWITGLKETRKIVVAPESTYAAAKRALAFAGPKTALMIIPAREQIPTAASAAFGVAEDDRAQPIALIVDFASFAALMKDINITEPVRRAAFRGLVPLQEGETKKNECSRSKSETTTTLPELP
jgi:hypothetical protein